MTIIFLNLALDICSLIIILITLYGVLFETRENNLKNKLFKYIVGTTLLCILVDLSSFYFIFTAPGGTGWYITSFLAAIPPFLWVSLVVFYLISIIRERRHISWRIGWIFAIVDLIAIIIGVIYGLRGEAFSWVDNHFEAGFMGPIVFLFNVFFLLFYGSICFYYRRTLGLHYSIAMFMYLLIPMSGLCLDASFMGVYSLLFCLTISVLLCFVMIQHRDLLAANRAKTVFLNNMSHDIRTPMNAIIGFTELVEQNIDNKEAVADYMSKIKVSGEYLLSLINNVLDMARIDSGKTELELECYDMSKYSDSLLVLFDDLVLKKKQTLEAKTDILNHYVMIDRVKMQQIAVNLISNAVKYTPEGGKIQISLSEMASPHDSYSRYIFEVKDNGIGMSPEFAEHIFDQFSRERNTTDSKIIGTGLGMSIVKKLVELMNGTISVSSRQGVGTTFTVDLKLKKVKNPKVAPKPEEKSIPASLNIAGRRVLLAEDNELNAEIAILMLEDKGIIVDHATDGLQCVKMLNDAPNGYYDIVLMDIQMPNLNGYEATRQIRALADTQKASIPIVAVTANAFEEDRQIALAAGMNDHLVKPIDSQSIFQVIAKHLRK